MLSYCPLEDETVAPIIQPKIIKNKLDPVGIEETECNYLVIFFILGVLVLAATDSIKK